MNFSTLFQSLFDYSISSFQNIKPNESNMQILTTKDGLNITIKNVLADYLRENFAKFPIQGQELNTLKLVNDGFQFQPNQEEISSVIHKKISNIFKSPESNVIFRNLDNYSKSFGSILNSQKYLFFKIFCVCFFSILFITFLILFVSFS